MPFSPQDRAEYGREISDTAAAFGVAATDLRRVCTEINRIRRDLELMATEPNSKTILASAQQGFGDMLGALDNTLSDLDLGAEDAVSRS